MGVADLFWIVFVGECDLHTIAAPPRDACKVGGFEFPCTASSDVSSRVGAGAVWMRGGDACIALGGRPLQRRSLPKTYLCGHPPQTPHHLALLHSQCHLPAESR